MKAKFKFKYEDRLFAFVLLAKAVRLLFTGKCLLEVTMSRPRDVVFMHAGQFAAKQFDLACNSDGSYKHDPETKHFALMEEWE